LGAIDIFSFFHVFSLIFSCNILQERCPAVVLAQELGKSVQRFSFSNRHWAMLRYIARCFERIVRLLSRFWMMA